MAPSSTGTTLKSGFAMHGGSDFDLSIETVASAPVIGALMNETGDGCGQTCESACSNSTCE